jgi:hypothetical protein
MPGSRRPLWVVVGAATITGILCFVTVVLVAAATREWRRISGEA